MLKERHFLVCGLVLVLLLLGACSYTPISPPVPPSALDPHGPVATRLADLWWVMLAIGTVVFLIVAALLFAALVRRKPPTANTLPDIRDGDIGRLWLVRGGILLPLLVLAIVFGYTIYTLAAVENPQDRAVFHIKVTARRWWWQVQYLEKNVETANEIHLPVGQPVQVQLVSEDVIHSFWVPELHGKMDVIPTHPNSITLQADQAGVYRGECAEFCGLQHAMMGFMVVAQSRDDFNKWLDDQQQNAATPTDATVQHGQQVFESAGCVYCHTVRGLDEQNTIGGTADLGPDLTHLSSRTTIAGASLTNNTGNLAGWVMDAQHIKPGSDMPRITLRGQDLQALLAYLESLR